MGQPQRRKRHHLNDKSIHKKARTRNRTKDLDQLFDDMKPEAAERLINQEPNHELPGMGQNYCVPCGRHFISAEHLADHESTKIHRRRVKLLQVEPYRGPDEKVDNGPRLNRPVE